MTSYPSLDAVFAVGLNKLSNSNNLCMVCEQVLIRFLPLHLRSQTALRAAAKRPLKIITPFMINR